MPNTNQSDSYTSTSPPDQGVSTADEVPALPEPAQEEIPPEVSAGLGASRVPAIVAGVIALVILLILVGIGIFLVNHPRLAAVLRDVFIILLAIESIIVTLLIGVAVVAIIYIALKVYDIADFVDNELRPMLARVDDTLSTVQSRTTFISDAAVKPVIDVMSYTSSVRAIIRAFTRPRG